MKPFLKWVGGKGRSLPFLLRRVPEQIETYVEPCAGGAALFFELARQRRFRRAVIADINGELVDTYRVVRDRPGELLSLLALHKAAYERAPKDFYLELKAKNPWAMLPVNRAARMICLNKTGFNGLYRVNKDGDFNVPFGRYTDPAICDAPTIVRASQALQNAEILCADYAEAMGFLRLTEGDCVYIDPPYLPAAKGSFTSYGGEFGLAEHELLEARASILLSRGVTVLVSNANTAKARELYAGWSIDTTTVNRTVGSSKRGKASELLARGWEG